MKTNLTKTVLVAAALMLALPLLVRPAQAAANGNPPEYMTYQGYVVDANGAPLGAPNPKNYDIVFRIWSDQMSTDATKRLWTEQQTVTVDNGYFSVLLGEGTGIGETRTTTISSLFTNADASDRFIELTVKGIGSGTTDVTIAPRLRMLSSPYAFLARSAVNAQSLANGLSAQIVTVTGTSVGVNKPAPTSALDVNGTVTATGLTVNGPSALNGAVTMATGAGINGTSVLEFGKGVAGKAVDAGKIGYQFADLGLNISGAGATGHRIVSILAEDGTYTFGGVGVNKGSLTAGYALDVNGSAKVSGAVAATSFTGNGTIPIGGIIMWSGATVPTGWALCDGTTINSVATPDLRSRFVVGSSTLYALKTTGGAATHTISTNEMPAHAHGVNHVGYGFHDGIGENRTVQQVTGTTLTGPYDTVSAGGSQSFSTLPPYYALAFIMRVQ